MKNILITIPVFILIVLLFFLFSPKTCNQYGGLAPVIKCDCIGILIKNPNSKQEVNPDGTTTVIIDNPSTDMCFGIAINQKQIAP